MYTIDIKRESEYKYVFLVVFAIFILTLFYEIGISFIDDYFYYYASFMGVLTVILFLHQFEFSIFKGRTTTINFLIWIFVFIVSALMLFLVLYAYDYIINEIDPLHNVIQNTDVIERRESFKLYLTSSFITYQSYQLIKFYVRRFQDLNISGHYFLLSLIPLVNFYIGYKIFQNNKKLIGVLVFLSIVLSYIILPFIPGDRGSNYFGFRPHLIREFKSKRQLLMKSKLLTEDQRMKMIDELVKHYSCIEDLYMHAFIEEQVNELV